RRTTASARGPSRSPSPAPNRLRRSWRSVGAPPSLRRTTHEPGRVTTMATANLDKIKVTRQVSRPGIVFAIDRLPGPGRMIIGGSDFKVYELDLDKEKPEPTPLGAHESYVTGLVCVNGNTVVSGGYDGRLIWWDVGARSPVRSIDAHKRWVRRLAI